MPRPLTGGTTGPPSSRARAYAQWTVRARWLIVTGWAATLLGLTVVARATAPAGDGLASAIPLDSPAIAAELRSVEHFGFPLSSRTVVVQRDPAGLSVFVQAESVLDAVSVNQTKPAPPLLGALPVTNALPLGGAAGESNTTVLTYLFMDPRSGFSSQQQAARDYISTYLDRPEDRVVGVAGSIPARAEQAGLVAAHLPRLELLTVLAILLLVGVTFRSVLAPLVALGASGVAFVTTVDLSRVLGALLGVGAPAELEPLLVALLLGVVTDYTVFYISALRADWTAGRPWGHAVVDAVASYTPIVIAAGITVAAGTAALLAAESPFFRGFGPAMALAVLVGLAVSVTLVPAVIAIVGPRLFWPAGTRVAPPADRPARTPLSRRLGLIDHLTRPRVAALVLLACLTVLTIASLPLRGIALGLGFTTSLPSDNPVARASVAGAAGFAPGITSPTTLLFEGPRVTDDIAALARMQQQVEEQPGVAGVLGPAQNFVQRNLGVVLARSGDAARMLVVLDNSPLEANAIRDLTGLRDRLPGMAAEAGLPDDVRISIAGDTALAAGLVGRTGHDLYRIAIAAILVNLFILVVLLRALVAPLYLLGCSVLALTASLGATVWLFMGRLGHESLTFYVPFAAAVLLVALGSDYNIFGVGHVWERARHVPLREAIRTAVPESTRAIMAAGVVLAVSFGMLAIIPLRPFRELGFAMAVGIMLDVVVVRTLLVPCLLTLVGTASAWPGHQLDGTRAALRPPRPDRVRAGAARPGPAPDDVRRPGPRTDRR